MNFDTISYDFATTDRAVSIIEIGVNHNGDIDLAKQMVREIAQRGGDIVKFQAFISEEEISVHAEKANYQKDTTGSEVGQLEMAKALELSHGQLTAMRDFCREMQVPFLCTAFESKSLAFLLNDLGVQAVKIASSEVTHHPFLAEIARSGVGMILSTGASTLEEVAAAVRVIEQAKPDPELAILHCVSEYPAPLEEVNLRAMDTMARAFGYPVGYSDHTRGITAPITAAALGACAIEKHFTLDRTMEGPDHRASIEPDELSAMTAAMKGARAALGDGIKVPVPSELPQLPLIRKSIVARHPLRAGHVITEADLAFKRPLNGIQPFDLDKVLGRALKNDKDEDAPLQWSDL
ncbi:N-acetylneuraminate synthase family protein [Roseobacter ponti]|uniref:N-acetylneuraminate synthase n=1 Tax=Roseobacter ponti TaxID=1891787 RepID=A0A858SZ03_9RHOB|nr:N-acetylneuraminate synthase family protein [Roseobacter ponti]QJF52883.1 N-acetylneuraminate synthase [Roseobacter ponti]